LGQYAERTDALVEDMQRFAQETPLQLAPVEVKPLLEGALHLSRLDKLHNLRVHLEAETACPPVLADSSQLLSRFSSDHFECDGRDGRGWRRRAFNLRTCLRTASVAFSSPDTASGFPASGTRIRTLLYDQTGRERERDLELSTCYGIIRQHDGDIHLREPP